MVQIHGRIMEQLLEYFCKIQMKTPAIVSFFSKITGQVCDFFKKGLNYKRSTVTFRKKFRLILLENAVTKVCNLTGIYMFKLNNGNTKSFWCFHR